MKHLACIVGIALITVGVYFLMFYVEIKILEGQVIPPAGVKIGLWLDGFKHWAVIGIGISCAASLLWYALGQCLFNIDGSGKANSGRIVWCLLLVLPAVAIILGIYYTKFPQEAGWIAFVFYILNAILCYYLTTALFSPDKLKYVVPGSKYLRFW